VENNTETLNNDRSNKFKYRENINACILTTTVEKMAFK
jgi:hypothetical protein